MDKAQIRKNLISEYRGGFCQGCGRDFSFDHRLLEVDHIRPRIDGGHDSYDNSTLLCRPCNSIKSWKFTLSGLQAKNKREGRLVETNLRLGKYAPPYSEQFDPSLEEGPEDTSEVYIKLREEFFLEREEAPMEELWEFAREMWHPPDSEMESVISGCIEVMRLEAFMANSGYRVRRNIYLDARETFFQGRQIAHIDELEEFAREMWHPSDSEMEGVVSDCIERMQLEAFPTDSGHYVRRSGPSTEVDYE